MVLLPDDVNPNPDKPELNIDPPEAERFVVSLAQRFQTGGFQTGGAGACAACRSVFSIKIDRSTQSLDPEVLEGRLSKGEAIDG